MTKEVTFDVDLFAKSIPAHPGRVSSLKVLLIINDDLDERPTTVIEKRTWDERDPTEKGHVKAHLLKDKKINFQLRTYGCVSFEGELKVKFDAVTK